MTIERITQFSPCRKYRYTLWRDWSHNAELWDCFDGCNDGERGSDEMWERRNSYLMVIGLNPSTADETKDDPTIRKCIGFAKRWGFGALCMTNLFAWRDTKPENMKRALSPVGETIDSNTSQNCKFLQQYAKEAGLILAAWGKDGSHLDRAAQVIAFMPPMKALKLNKDGSPMHPLYAPYETVPINYP